MNQSNARLDKIIEIGVCHKGPFTENEILIPRSESHVSEDFTSRSYWPFNYLDYLANSVGDFSKYRIREVRKSDKSLEHELQSNSKTLQCTICFGR